MNKSDYLKMLNDGFVSAAGGTAGFHLPHDNKIEWLGEYIFRFETGDRAFMFTFARRAIDVCAAITSGTTYEYIKDPDNHLWYLMMVNTPFFSEKIDWGCSIRGAFWKSKIRLDTVGLYLDDECLSDTLEFNTDQWSEFIYAVLEFGR